MENERLRMRMAPAPSGFLHLGMFAPSSLMICTIAAMTANWCCESRTPTPNAHRRRRNPIYRTAFSGWESPGKRGPTWAAPSARTGSRERSESHRAAALELLENGHAYKCFCTREELEEERKQQEARSEAPRYSRRCRNLTPEERTTLEADGREASIRFRVPDSQTIGWDDMVYGTIEFQSDDIGDFVILRPNGAPIYNLANVADDHHMRITVALRSQSHISYTPRQLMMYNALGWTAPAFAHVPDVLDLQGRKMGKRHGAKGVTEYREEGYLPQAVVNYIALLGWSPHENEFLSMNDLTSRFSFDAQKSNAAFDSARLEWFNGQWIRRLSVDELLVESEPFLAKAGLMPDPHDEPARQRMLQILPLVQERVRTLAEIPAMIDFFFRDSLELEPSTLTVKQRSPAEVSQALKRTTDAAEILEPWTSEEIATSVKTIASELGWKHGELFMVLRIAETGRTVTPPLTESMEILGKASAVGRMRAAIRVLEQNLA